jgi:hypothetical protein
LAATGDLAEIELPRVGIACEINGRGVAGVELGGPHGCARGFDVVDFNRLGNFLDGAGELGLLLDGGREDGSTSFNLPFSGLGLVGGIVVTLGFGGRIRWGTGSVERIIFASHRQCCVEGEESECQQKSITDSGNF